MKASLPKFSLKNWQYFVVYNKWTSLFVVSFTAFLALSAWISFEQMVNVQNKARMRNRTSQIELAIQDRMNSYVDVLIHTRGLFMVSGRPSLEKFAAYIRGIDLKNRFRGIRSIGYGKFVTHDDVGKLKTQMSSQGFTDFKVWPPTDKAMASPVVMLEPMDSKKLRSLGFNMMSEKNRREAIEAAIDSGQPIMTRPVTLLNEEKNLEKKSSFIIYLPVYDRIEIPKTIEERRATAVGVIFGSFESSELFNGIFGKPDPQTEEIDFSVTMLGSENGGPEQNVILYDRFAITESPLISLKEKGQIQILNTSWDLEFESTAKFVRTIEWMVPKIVGIASMIFAVMVFFIVTTIRRHIEVQDKNRKLIQEAEAKSRRQSDIQRQLNEMSQYISAEIDFDELLKRVVLLAQYLTKVKFSSVLYRTKDGEGEIFLPFANEEHLQESVNFESYDVKSLVGLFSGTHAIWSEDTTFEHTFELVKPSSPYKHWLALPIFSRMGQLKAILLLVDDKKVASEEDVLLLLQGLAAQISIGIENALLFKKAEEGSRAKSFFLANMSHEIRTPLGAILGFSELIAKPEINDQQKKEFVGNIKKNGEQLTRIIDDILDISKVEAGKVIIEKKAVHLSPLLYQIQSLMNMRAKEKNIKFEIRTEGMLPEEFLTDEIRLKQILMNVIGNAIKFTDSGTVTLLCKMSNNEYRDQSIDFYVTDTGCGIAENTQKVLFSPFSQADSSLTRKHGGTGLGLSLSKRLAEQLGGSLTLVQSKEGEGSTFLVRIRCKAPQGLRHMEAPIVSQPGKAKPVVRIGLEGTQILLVEDSQDNQEIFKYYLENAGAQVELVEDGLSAVRKATEKDFDIILMDIQVPGIDGKEATRRIRSRGYERPIVALTAHAMVEERQSCLDAGCDGQITKPVTGDQLISEISNYLSEGHAQL